MNCTIPSFLSKELIRFASRPAGQFTVSLPGGHTQRCPYATEDKRAEAHADALLVALTFGGKIEEQDNRGPIVST